MSGVTLNIQADQWRSHLDRYADRVPGVVPVAKGNGYGFGLARLAREAERIGAPRLAVGLPSEVDQVREHFSGDIVVLTPWRPDDHEAVRLARDPRIILTVSRLADLDVLTNLGDDLRPRMLIEVQTSMLRHGIKADNLPGLAEWFDLVTFEGWTIHLPMGDTLAEAKELTAQAIGVRRAPVWYSHLDWAQAVDLSHEHGFEPLLRVGTALWLGQREALRTTATVLDVHPVRRGSRAGYWQHKVPGDGWIVVVAGGTANGVGLAAPSPGKNVRGRAVAAATGGLEALGRALSPYTIAGKKRWFVEPPHMQSSLVFLPGDVEPPAVGDEVPVEVRLTTASVDQTLER
ncbi:alanine racemase [Parenemella sanctibonifatiensis]|uniref:Alanine racemase n=1 Tax=Parenemella sanctibonifatiensis TaxID=2016505 RepID=A0A255EEL2_9ACTN|nr:alanine racemase [Parenemella sanctibonifatiensis]OYN89371.1 alanine racemase [Parenemella sanctibonifatiensis]